MNRRSPARPSADRNADILLGAANLVDAVQRTLASTAAFGCLAWALVLRGRMGRAQQPQRTDVS
jgi:hypothetical protein